MHAGMSWERLDALGGIQWPCYSRGLARAAVPPRPTLGRRPRRARRPAPFSVVVAEGPGRTAQRRLPAAAHDRSAARLLQHRRPVRRVPQPEPHRRDGRHLPGRRHRPRPRRRRGRRRHVTARSVDRTGADRPHAAARPGVHDAALPGRGRRQPLTIDATDPKSGTAEFKAASVRIDKVPPTSPPIAPPRCPRGCRMDLKTRRHPATDADARASSPCSGVPSRPTPATDVVGTARARRHLLLPTLHAVNDRVGWISPEAIDDVAERLDVAPAEIHASSRSTGCSRPSPRPNRQVHVCVDLAAASPVDVDASPHALSSVAVSRRCATGARRRS